MVWKLPSNRLFAACVAGWLGAGRAAFPADAEALIQANFGEVTDARGMRWDLTQMGTVDDGTNDCFDTAAVLTVNRRQISFQRPMMTKEHEYVLSAKTTELRITRRVRLDAENAAVRYLEIFENISPAPFAATVTVQTSLGHLAEQFVDAAGKVFGGTLDKGQGCFVATRQADDNRPGVVFLVADPRAKEKPQVVFGNSRRIEVTYKVTVPAGSSLALVHYLAQRPAATSHDAKALLEVYYKRGRLADRTVPAEIGKLLANFNAGDAEEAAPGPSLAQLDAVAEAANIPRQSQDVLAIDRDSQIVGTVTGGDLEIETAFGKTRAAFAEVAGIAGGESAQRPVRIFLRDGEVLTGAVSGADWRIESEGGVKFGVDFAGIHLLLLRAAEQDGAPLPGHPILLSTPRGDCLAVAGGAESRFEAASPWGMIQARFDEVESLTSVREPFPAHRLVLADGSRLPVMLRGGEWSVRTARFGLVKMLPQSVSAIRRAGAGASAEDREAAKPTTPFCELAGGHWLTGTIDLPALHLGPTSALKASEIVRLEMQPATANAAATVSVELAGGVKLKGALDEKVLPIRSGSRVWRVPVAHLVSYENPPPEPAEAPAPDSKVPDSLAPPAPAPK